VTPPLVMVGASWGGPAALGQLLELLGEDLPFAVAVVQHRAAGADERVFAAHLQKRSRVPVTEAMDKEPISARHVFLAPGGYHLLVDADRFSLDVEEPVNHSRPSVDVLFETGARSLGSAATAVVLTGTGADGAAGLRAVARAGGVTVAQDPREAERPGMPEAAIATGAVAHVLPLRGIADLLLALHAQDVP
jgi:two-component system, chemotaxis family, protein-glutamate methylesterase/glutaminase